MALCAVVLLRPTPAQAAYARVVAAAQSVSSYHISQWVQRPDGTRVTGETWYDHGRWRTESHQDDQLLDLQVYDGEKLRLYDPQANRVWMAAGDDPFITEAGAFTVTALLQRGRVREGELTVERTQDGSGSPANRFTIATQDPGRIVVLADPKTDLPLSIEYYLPKGADWILVGAADTIEYDTPIGSDRFVLTPPEGADVMDRTAWAKSFWKRYDQDPDRTVVGGHECALRDFQVVANGDVFAIWTWTGFFAGGGGWGWEVPENRWKGYTRIYPAGPAKLEDSLGTVYVYAGITGFCAGKWGDGYGWFVAQAPPASQPAWYRLTLPYDWPKGELGAGFNSWTASFTVRRPVTVPGAAPIYPPDSPRPRGERTGPGGWEFWVSGALDSDRSLVLEAYASDPRNYREEIVRQNAEKRKPR